MGWWRVGVPFGFTATNTSSGRPTMLVTMVNSASIAPRAWWPSGTCPVPASPPGLFCKGKVESILPSTPATIAMSPQGKRYRKGHGHHGHSPPIWAYTEQISVTYLFIVVSFSFFLMNDLFERTMGAYARPGDSPQHLGEICGMGRA